MFTLDLLERWMRNFSYCSMAKMRFGIALVSRRTLAYRAKMRRPKFQAHGVLKIPSQAVSRTAHFFGGKLLCLLIK